jgi:S-adenosyl methyltransferase
MTDAAGSARAGQRRAAGSARAGQRTAVRRKGPAGLDPTIPNAARMYDYYLGGKDNFAADRQAAGQVLAVAPEIAPLSRANRAFLGRAVEFLAKAGIRQFIDIGTGLPTQRSVHEVARETHPGAAVVYVDNDPVVCTHARALVGGLARTAVVQADMRRPADILGCDAMRNLINFAEPVALLFLSVLHFITDDQEAAGIVAAFGAAMAPGSYLVISHTSQGSASAHARDSGLAIYARSSAPVSLRQPEEIARLFGGFELIPPGLVDVALWRPRGSAATPMHGIRHFAGVARQP